MSKPVGISKLLTPPVFSLEYMRGKKEKPTGNTLPCHSSGPEILNFLDFSLSESPYVCFKYNSPVFGCTCGSKMEECIYSIFLSEPPLLLIVILIIIHTRHPLYCFTFSRSENMMWFQGHPLIHCRAEPASSTGPVARTVW